MVCLTLFLFALEASLPLKQSAPPQGCPLRHRLRQPSAQCNPGPWPPAPHCHKEHRIAGRKGQVGQTEAQEGPGRR